MTILSLHLSTPLITHPSDVLYYLIRHYFITPSNIYESYYSDEYTCSKRLAEYGHNPNELTGIIEQDLIEYISKTYSSEDGYHLNVSVEKEDIDIRRYNLIVTVFLTDKYGNKYSVRVEGLGSGESIKYLSFNNNEPYSVDDGKLPSNPYIPDPDSTTGDDTVCADDCKKLGIPTDGNFDDGLLKLYPDMTVADAIDDINEFLQYLLPQAPKPLSSDINYSISFRSAYIANGSNVGSLIPGTQCDKIINTDNFTASTPNNDRFNKADKGTLALVNENNETLDSFPLETKFNEDERSSEQSYPPEVSSNGFIEITEVKCYNNFPMYQKGVAVIHFNGLLNPGYNAIKILHRMDDETQGTNLQTLFYDDEDPITISNVSLSISVTNSLFLSGIRFIDKNSELVISFVVDKLFHRTYLQSPISINANWLNEVVLAWNDSHSSGYSNPPNENDQWIYSNSFSPNRNYVGNTIDVNIQAEKLFKNETGSTSINGLFIFNPVSSTNVAEYFQSENYRLPLTMIDNDSFPSLTGNWDSSLPLENGNAQVFLGKVIYPHEDFTNLGYPPDQQNNTDYSGFSGNQVYARAFKTSTPRNNGSIDIEGISWNDINSNVKIEMKVPGVTGWLDLGKYYSPSDFSGADGNGNLVTHENISGGIRLNWTIGSFSTVDSDNIYILKITLISNSIEITKIEETG